MVSQQGGFSGTVTLTATTNLPSRASVTFTPKSLVPPNISRLAISTPMKAAGTYWIDVTATSGKIVRTVRVNLTLY
jgi:hypothetical protein